MPFTLNGIGTRYYGGGNRSVRADTCAQCHRSTKLSSYDTREWICFVYIPVIPMRKYRIVDQCSSCRRHYRLTFAEFSKRVANDVDPLREAVRLSPADPQPYLDLVNGLLSWEVRSEAQKEIDAAVARFPNDARVQALAGQMAIDRGDWKGALPFLDRAQSIDPENGQAVYAYGRVLYQLERDTEAIPVLQRATAQAFNQPGALYLIGTSNMRLERWSEALQVYQQLLGLKPDYISDKMFIRRIAECKRRLGYVLSDVERKAGRKWWPFGKKY